MPPPLPTTPPRVRRYTSDDSDSESDSESDHPPITDFRQTMHLRDLLEHAPWTREWYYAGRSSGPHSFSSFSSSASPLSNSSSPTEKWVYISHDGSMFEGAWYRHTYSPNAREGTEVACSLRSHFSPSRGESVIHWFGPRYTTVLEGDTKQRRELVMNWLTRNTTLIRIPRLSAFSNAAAQVDWRLTFVRGGCELVVMVWTYDSGGRIHKPLIRAQATLKGMEVVLFYDKARLLDPLKLMDDEMGLVNLVVLYFAGMKFQPMPPPPLPLKAQEMLARREGEDGEDEEDSEEDSEDEAEEGEVVGMPQPRVLAVKEGTRYREPNAMDLDDSSDDNSSMNSDSDDDGEDYRDL
ncbi:hypothetical protein NMY22_g11021 [Coprinellus aureogranulatus]|nr:hypothetical protein NMY22_g11021 [Coprinellus aureogranulatus]